jgi:hypothetical protein
MDVIDIPPILTYLISNSAPSISSLFFLASNCTGVCLETCCDALERLKNWVCLGLINSLTKCWNLIENKDLLKQARQTETTVTTKTSQKNFTTLLTPQ